MDFSKDLKDFIETVVRDEVRGLVNRHYTCAICGGVKPGVATDLYDIYRTCLCPEHLNEWELFSAWSEKYAYHKLVEIRIAHMRNGHNTATDTEIEDMIAEWQASKIALLQEARAWVEDED